MKKNLFKEIEVPKDVEFSIEGNSIIIKGPAGENKKTFNIHKLVFEKRGNKIIIGNEKATKKEKKSMNTIASHIKNMIQGVQKKFEYKLKSVFSHFPITVEIKEDEVTIKNFLGEKVPRKLKIPEGTEVKVEKDTITVSSTNKELAGQVAANFEAATKVKSRDRRVFQDGIFIVNKTGKEI